MSTIGDAIDKEQAEFVDFEKQQAATEAVEAVPVASRGFTIPEWVKAQTGPGDVEDYVNHPLNFAKSKGFAQVLRGLTGIVGELRYALLDIGMGILQMSKERKVKTAVEVASHVGPGH